MPREWTPKQVALMDWLSLPGDDLMGEGKGLREPKTLTELAVKLGVVRRTLYDWMDLPGWDEARAVRAKQMTLDLEPEYLKSLSVAMMKPNPNDRLVVGYWRYVSPILRMEKERGEWSNILPETTTGQKEDTEQFFLEQFRKLPTEHRERILAAYDEMMNNQNGDILVEKPKLKVRRTFTEADEKYDAKLEAQSYEGSIIENEFSQNENYESVARAIIPVPALPQPAQVQPSRYNPRLRKPLRKPKE